MKQAGINAETEVKELLDCWTSETYETKRGFARKELARFECTIEFLKDWDKLPILETTMFKFFEAISKGQEVGKEKERANKFISEWQEIITLRPSVRERIVAVGVSDESLKEWDGLEIPSFTLRKFKIPDSNDLQEWSSLKKDYKALQRIRHPLLCNWSKTEIIEAMAPAVGAIVAKYQTKRCPIDDCKQNGAVGILLALRTDIGDAPFASHAYHRTRTNIRRPSATSNITKEAEKRPSITEAKEAIGNWLSATWTSKQLESAKLKKAPLNKKKIVILNDFVLCRVQLKNSSGIKAPTSKHFKILEFCFEFEKRYGKKPTSEQIISGLSKEACTEKMISEAFQREAATKPLIRGSFPLSRLDLSTLTDLMEYLNIEFNPPRTIFKDSDSDLFGKLNRERFTTVEDLIRHVATSPDFHGNPTALDVPIEDGYSIGATCADVNSPDPTQMYSTKHSRMQSRDLVFTLRQQIILTPEQEMVMVESYGLDGVTEKSGSFIANHFGMLIALHRVRSFIIKAVNSGRISHEVGERIVEWSEILPKEGQKLQPDVAAMMAKQTTTTAIKCVKKYAPELVSEASPLAVIDRTSVSRQRITQFLDAIGRKLLDAAFEHTFLKRSNPKEAISLAMKNTELSAFRRELADYFFGLVGKCYSLDEVAIDLDVFLDEKTLKALDGNLAGKSVYPARREFLKEQLVIIKRVLLDAIL